MAVKVLIVEDEMSIRSFININLKRAGFEIIEAASGEEAIKKLKEENDIRITILDVMLPGIDGFEVCEHTRKQYPKMGIIMLTARGQEEDKIMGLKYGADDYVVKPFSPKELTARAESLLRRVNMSFVSKNIQNHNNLIELGIFSLDENKVKLYKKGEEIELTPTEFAIVKLLMKNVDKAVSRDEILNEVWGKFYVGDLKVVDVNIRRIRSKIEEDSKNPLYIETVWGYGYCFKQGD